MLEESDVTQIESRLRRTLREIRRNVSITETYESDQVDATFADLGLLYATLSELWGDVRELKNGNYVHHVDKGRKEDVVDAYEYVRDMANRIENGERMRKVEQLPIKTYLDRLEN